MAKQKFYKLGVKGVDLSEDELHMSDETVLSCQNAEVVYDHEKGGEMTLSKRGGLTPLGGSLGATIGNLFDIRFLGEDLPVMTSFPAMVLPRPWSLSAAGPSFTSPTLNASGDRLAFIIQVPKSGTLDWFEWRTGAVSNNPDNGMRTSFQSLAAATGNPDGVQSQYRDTTGTFTANTWQTPSGVMTSDGTDNGTKRTVTKGEYLACVVDFTSFVALDSIQVSYVAGPTQQNYSYISDGSGGSYVKTAGSPCIALRYSDGSYAELFSSALPAQTFTTLTFNSGTTPDEYALRFKVPVSCRCAGVWAFGSIAGDTQFVLYDSSSNALGTHTTDVDFRINQTTNHLAYFPASVELTANAIYRIAVKPAVVGTNAVIYQVDAAANAQLATMEGGIQFYQSSRTNGGAWTDVDSSRPTIGLILDGFLG